MWILKQDPDVICLQEVPGKMLSKLIKSSNMYVNYVIDFESKVKEEKNIYNVILTKLVPERINTFSYFEEESKTLYSKIVYNKINKMDERHKGISVVIKKDNTNINIMNAHFSCAIGSKKRITQIKNTLEQTNKEFFNIICGDFNIMSNKIIKKAAGKKNGYTKEDHKIDERKEVEKLFEDFDLLNLFYKKTTTSFAGSKLTKLQHDHILVNKHAIINDKKLYKNFGSDHKILFADITV